jgi:hypothetical protein
MAYYCEGFSSEASNILPGGQAASALAAGDLVYMNSSGQWALAAAGTVNAEGIVDRDKLIYEFFSPVKCAQFSGWTSQTIGAKAYLTTTGTTGNTISATKPAGAATQAIGFFMSASKLCVSVGLFDEAGAISIYGSDGKFKASYATIDAAIAALATDDILIIKSGTYSLSAACDITKTGVKIVGDGIVTIKGAANAAYCFKTVFGALTSTSEITFKNVTIDHDIAGTTKATMAGIWIINTSATKKINVYLDNVEFESGGGQSIDVDNADATAAIRVYAKDCVTEGPVGFAQANAGDRFRFREGTLRGGLVLGTTDVAAEIFIMNSVVLHQGCTGGANTVRLWLVNCESETDADPNVYAITDAADTGDGVNVYVNGTVTTD